MVEIGVTSDTEHIGDQSKSCGASVGKNCKIGPDLAKFKVKADAPAPAAPAEKEGDKGGAKPVGGDDIGVYLGPDCDSDGSDMIKLKKGDYTKRKLKKLLDGKGLKYIAVERDYSITLYQGEDFDMKYIHVRGGREKCLEYEAFNSDQLRSLNVAYSGK
eukprot:Pgem_evm1s13802